MSKIRVFVIDDNVMIRYALRNILEQENDITVVGDSAYHEKIEEEINRLHPDVLVVDIPLPRDSGIRKLKEVNSKRLPVIVFTKSGDTMVNDIVPLLEIGAVAFVLKPKKDEAIKIVQEELLAEIRNQVVKKNNLNNNAHHQDSLSVLDPLRVVAIGSSTGGPEALSMIMPQFPANFPAGIVIVQHMPKMFTPGFAARLNGLSAIRVKEAANGDLIRPGQALLAPGDFHMVFEHAKQDNKSFAKVRLTSDPPQWGLRPTVDKMMTSLTPIFGHNITGVILTGMGADGVIGMRAIKKAGGRTLVQNEANSVVFGMAQEVIKNNLADEVWPLEKIVPRILEMLKVN